MHGLQASKAIKALGIASKHVDLWNILTLHTCFLMKYNSMGINRVLYSLEKETQESYGYSPKLLFVKSNKLDYILGTSL